MAERAPHAGIDLDLAHVDTFLIYRLNMLSLVPIAKRSRLRRRNVGCQAVVLALNLHMSATGQRQHSGLRALQMYRPCRISQ